MSPLDHEDIEILNSLDCFHKMLIKDDHGAGYPPHQAYRLISTTWKPRLMGFLSPRKVEEETFYIFVIGDAYNYGWFRNPPGEKIADICFKHSDDWKINFEEVFENVSEDLKCKLIYHLDIFNPK